MFGRPQFLVALLVGSVGNTVLAQTSLCFQNFDAITVREGRFVDDFNKTREYVLCPNTMVEIGKLDFSNKLIPGSGQDFVSARPNLIIKCGEDGSRTNNCVVLGGDVQIDATEYLGVTIVPTNVRFEGITFGASTRYTLWATKPGDITFIDCVFRDNTVAMAPIYLDYFDADKPDSFLSVSFQRCEFTSNRYFGEGANPAIITANGNQNRLSFDRCIFTNNDYIFNNTRIDRNSFLIETSGQISIKRSCFENNDVGVSSIAVYASEVTSELNYGFFSNGQKCQFISSFQTTVEYRFFSPRCISFDTTSGCVAEETETPSATPSSRPSVLGSDQPSMSPSELPTASPTSLPTVVASFAPSSSPLTPQPTSIVTGSPSASPDATSNTSPNAALTPAPVAGGPNPGANPGTGTGTSSSTVVRLSTVASALVALCVGGWVL